jgi:hypothetical protein
MKYSYTPPPGKNTTFLVITCDKCEKKALSTEYSQGDLARSTLDAVTDKIKKEKAMLLAFHLGALSVVLVWLVGTL